MRRHVRDADLDQLAAVEEAAQDGLQVRDEQAQVDERRLERRAPRKGEQLARQLPGAVDHLADRRRVGPDGVGVGGLVAR